MKSESVQLSNRSMVHQAIDSENWENLDWKYHLKTVFRLQKRIFKAVREENIAKAKRLQRLLLNSYSARVIAIRQVTQLNQGKKTAGIDGKKALTHSERFTLEKQLKKHCSSWKHQGLREIPIPKKDGTTRLLKVPTIADRAWQCLIKIAIEPAHEATFHARSYGFRPGRSTHDAQKVIFMNLNKARKGWTKKVLEMDIEKCFDRINHNAILDRVICPKYLKTGINRCLKAGIKPGYPEQGTPQGGVCSPLLANIALNGIERIGEFKGTDGVIRSKCVRYADDMIYFLKPGDSSLELYLVHLENYSFIPNPQSPIPNPQSPISRTDIFKTLGLKLDAV